MAYLSKTDREFALWKTVGSVTENFVRPTHSTTRSLDMLSRDSETSLRTLIYCSCRHPLATTMVCNGIRIHCTSIWNAVDYIRAKIVKADGTNLTDKEKTGIINLPLQTIVVASGCLGRRVREIVEGSGFVEMYLFDGELIGRCGKETQLLRNCKFPIGFTQIRHFLFSFFTGSSCDETRPLDNFTDASTIEFAVSGQGSEYIVHRFETQ
jgi:hypothetical protein